MTASNHQDEHRDHGIIRGDLRGTWGMERVAELSGEKAKERAEQVKLWGLEATPSIVDRSLTLFQRDLGGVSAFMQAPFLQDVRQLGGQDVVIVGVSLDTGTTYRAGTRFGPETIRHISAFLAVEEVEMRLHLASPQARVNQGVVLLSEKHNPLINCVHPLQA